MDFEAWLTARFRPPADRRLDVVFALAVPGDAGSTRLVTFAVRDGELCFHGDARPDATFFFDSPDTAMAILGGEADPFAAFMAGRFRADGNLPLAFVLLGLFRDDYVVEPPP